VTKLPLAAPCLARVLIVLLVLTAGCGPDDTPPEPPDAPVAPLSEDQRAALEALGYVSTVPSAAEDGTRSGVTLHDRERAFDGLNLFNERDQSAASLMDMEGEVRHSWSSQLKGDTFAQMNERYPRFMPSYLRGWNLVEMLPDGDLLVIGTHHMLLRLSWDSTPEWKLDFSAHHDLEVAGNGDIYVLEDSLRQVEFDGGSVTIQDNAVVVVSPAGEVERRFSIYDAMSDESWSSVLAPALQRIEGAQAERLAYLRQIGTSAGGNGQEIADLYEAAVSGDFEHDEGIQNILCHGKAADIFHSNSVKLLPRDEPGLWRKGDLLVSVRNLDLVVVLDQDSGKVVWSWGRTQLQRAHHATALDDGHIQIFDNGTRRGYSRIVEVDPRSGKITWSYEASPPSAFYSSACGSSQRLPNGNVLISETNRGRAFEVDPTGAIVWTFLSGLRPRGPQAVDPNEPPKRAAIYRMTRLQAPPQLPE
jgi:outer membrane protein assembly factor BamB